MNIRQLDKEITEITLGPLKFKGKISKTKLKALINKDKIYRKDIPWAIFGPQSKQ
ncbi:MAG: hypothetical protein ACOC80_00630 [Petrotogales bacterium]